jgi:ParB-like chromosome segregation protein Spo0J
MMSREEIAELAKDIKANGLRQKIVLDMPDGAILDGRNRYAACKVAGVKPEFEVYAGNDPISYVLSLNLNRRHLTEAQKAMVASKVATLRHGSNQHAKKEEAHACASSKSRADANETATTDPKPLKTAAAEVGVSERAVQQARKVRETAAPEVVTAVEKGDLSLRAAEKIAAQPVEVQKKIIAADDPAEALKEAEAEDDGMPTKDRLGNPLPDVAALRQAFADSEQLFGAALNHLTQLTKLAGLLKSDDDGKHPAGAAWYNKNGASLGVKKNIDDLRQVFRFARPYAVCPFCKGHGKDRLSRCLRCSGLGWLCESTFKQIPEQDRKTLLKK